MNSIFERGGEASIPLTYMTGTLVKMGQHLANVFFRGTHAAWLQHFVMVIGLTAGAFVGGFSYLWWGLGSLYVATILVIAITAFTFSWRSRARRGTRVVVHTEPVRQHLGQWKLSLGLEQYQRMEKTQCISPITAACSNVSPAVEAITVKECSKPSH